MTEQRGKPVCRQKWGMADSGQEGHAWKDRRGCHALDPVPCLRLSQSWPDSCFLLPNVSFPLFVGCTLCSADDPAPSQQSM